jgi:beta-carotene hydroxylase
MSRPNAVTRLPSLQEVGRDLLTLPRWRVLHSLLLPFLLFAGYCAAAGAGWWIVAVACVVCLSFVTYGSVSHDLVHSSLGLPRRVNDLLLTVIELLMFRSGRAYRLAHLNHHSRYPDESEDPEAAAAFGSLAAALISGPMFFPRLWLWAFRRYPAHRPRLALEAVIILTMVTGAAVGAVWSVVPVVYFALAYLGGWIVPLATAYIPHVPDGDDPMSQTRRFRGLLARLIAFDHLYHLEHHLYPAVPHHCWPELARRLDPALDRAGVRVVRLGFGGRK